MTEHIQQFFAYAHLPENLRAISKPFGELAEFIVASTPRNPERTVALRKLLESKDAAVRAALAKDVAPTVTGTKIIVNGKEVETTFRELTYEQIVMAALMTGTPSVNFRVRNTTGGESIGIMHPGSGTIVLTEGLVFNVAHTGNA